MLLSRFISAKHVRCLSWRGDHSRLALRSFPAKKARGATPAQSRPSIRRPSRPQRIGRTAALRGLHLPKAPPLPRPITTMTPSITHEFPGRGSFIWIGHNTRKIKILERAESMGDVPTRRTAARKTLHVNCGPCNVVLTSVLECFPRITRSARNHDRIQADRVF